MTFRALAVLLAGLVLLAPGPRSPRAEAASSRLGSPEIFGYLPYWQLDADVDYGALTTVAFFGLGAGADGRLIKEDRHGWTTEYSRWRSAKVTRAIAQAHAHGVRFVLTIERMAWDDGGKAATRALLGSRDRRSRLANAIVNEVVRRGIDGVSLDFEPMLSDVRDQFAAFVRTLRERLDAVNPAYQLTFAATGSQARRTYEMFGTLTSTGAADAVLIMAYPLRGMKANHAGGLAPLVSPTSYDLASIARAYLKRVGASKIVMLLPWYGRQWPTITDQPNSLVHTNAALYGRPHNVDYVRALEYAIANGRRLDPETSAYSVFRARSCPGCPEAWRQVYYDDVETLGIKYDWIVGQGMAGIGIWSLGDNGARSELWKLLRVKFRGLSDIAPPTGTATPVGGEPSCSAASVWLTLDADDGPAGSGVAYVRLSPHTETGESGMLIDGITYPATNIVQWAFDGGPTAAIDESGDRNIQVQWRDVAGNWSLPMTAVRCAAAQTSAQIELAYGRMAVSTPVVPVTVTHDGGPAIARVLISNSPATTEGVLQLAVEASVGVTTDFSLIETGTGGVDVDGPHAVYVQWQDEQGRWAEPVPTSVVLDRVPPTGELSIAGDPELSSTGVVAVVAPATDPVTQVTTVELSNDGTHWQPYPFAADPISWTAGTMPDGPWTVSARWTDAAGNTSAPASASLLLDREAPIGSVTLDGGDSFTREATVLVEAAATDVGSSVSTVALSNSPALANGVLRYKTAFVTGKPIAWSLSGAGAPASVDDGLHTVYAQWRDAGGHWSPVASASIIVDRSPPIVGAPSVAIAPRTQIHAAAVSVEASWLASDDGSGLAKSFLEASRPGSAWTVVPATGSGTAAVVDVEPGSGWQLRATAADHAGNSGIATGDPFSVVVIQDSAPTIAFSGGWSQSTTSRASGGTTRYATSRGATATFDFSGRSVAWVAPVGRHKGKAKVLIDGQLVTTVDLRAGARARVVVFSASWAVGGDHLIKLKVLGTAGRPRVDVDAFVVLQ